jgi:small subunit ribosomal protein S1
MTTTMRFDKAQPPHDSATHVEESYWHSLLNEGEFAQSSAPDLVHETLEFGNETENDFSAEPHQNNDWQEATRIMADDEALYLPVVGFNRGGLLVEWRTLRGFVPASQLMSFPATDNYVIRRNLLTEKVGQSLLLRIIEIDAGKNRLIFSERAAQVQSGTRTELLQRIKVGDIIVGHITNLVEFGAFADLGGLEGLIHISELSWGRVGHPSDILQRGQHVQVYVLEVDPDMSRIALSLKRLNPDPWATVETRYRIGEVIEGRITNVVDFGAFACLEDGLEGLIHFSELAEGHFLHPRNVVAEGDTVRAKIMTIDSKARRIGLTLRVK